LDVGNKIPRRYYMSDNEKTKVVRVHE